MDVYWINCILACTLSYIFGWYMAKRTLTRHFAMTLERVLKSLQVTTKVTSDLNVH